ncbi:sugar transferase, partial [Candidatus Saccharibacteria bacterium]|nr:sugar transferase [Candidatus Saccharibacteria bacterium]
FTTKPLFPSKSVVIYGLAISTVLIITMRFILSVIKRWLYRFNIGRRHVVVIGKGVAADALTFAFQKNRGYKLERTITNDVDALDSLKRLLRRHHIDEIYMANTRVSEKEQLKLIRFAHENHIVYKYIPTLTDLYQAKMQTLALADMPVLEVVRTPLEGWSRIIKTMADYIIGLIVLVVLSPLFLILSIIIKLTDGGNVFYRHSRVGRYGKKIEVWKFRSMYMQYSTGSGFSGKTDAEILSELGDYKMVAEFKKEQKLKNDPRVTPIGRFLRKTSLDELPQLFNVLRGELSLIGPRPVTSDELERYNESASTFLLIKPGITGLWQVSGRNDIGYDERIRLDVYYVEHWSVWLDCKIFARTLKVVLFGKGY